VIRNGINFELFQAKDYYRTRSRVRMICVCRMVPRKGLQFLIDAMESLGDCEVELQLIGSGQEYKRIHRYVLEQGLSDRIKLLGYIPRDQLPKYYAHAEIFILPSLSESFGQVLLEAMSCGLPVIASRVGGIPETIQDRVGGLLVPPGDSEALVGAIRFMADHPSARLRMGRKNAAIAREDYGWASIAQQYESLYFTKLAEREAIQGDMLKRS
jgi:glycosyltransferase involved in cell wall biosynthesis